MKTLLKTTLRNFFSGTGLKPQIAGRCCLTTNYYGEPVPLNRTL